MNEETKKSPCDIPGACAKMNRKCDVCAPAAPVATYVNERGDEVPDRRSRLRDGDDPRIDHLFNGFDSRIESAQINFDKYAESYLLAMRAEFAALMADMLAAAPAAPVARPLHIGACITDGMLYTSVMRRESNGHTTVVATAKMDAASLHKRDCIAQMTPASDPAAPVAQCACLPDVLLDSYAGFAAPEGLFGRVTLLINGQRADYVPAPVAPVAQGEPCRFPGCQFTGCHAAGCYDTPSPAPASQSASDADIDAILPEAWAGMNVIEYGRAVARSVLALRPVSVQPLTDEQIRDEYLRPCYASDAMYDWFEAGARFAERKHGIGQGGA